MISVEGVFRNLIRHKNRFGSALPPLNPHDFTRPAHPLIWKALVTLAYQGLEISPRAAASRLKRIMWMGSGKAIAEALPRLGLGG